MGSVPRREFDANPELGNEEKTDGQECPSSSRYESNFTVTTLVSPAEELDAERHCARRAGSSMSLIAGALLAMHAAILLSAAPQQAPTIDEIWHLPAGISYWQRGEFWCYHHNPPVMRWLYSWPAIVAGAEVDYSRFVYRPKSRHADFEFGAMVNFGTSEKTVLFEASVNSSVPEPAVSVNDPCAPETT